MALHEFLFKSVLETRVNSNDKVGTLCNALTTYLKKSTQMLIQNFLVVISVTR